MAIAKPKKVTFPKEEQEQINFVTWLEKNNIVHFAIPNGGKRNLLEAFKFKRCGVKSGIPDVCIPIASQPYHGLYIELKRVRGGVISESQKEWQEKLRKNGYCCEIAKGSEEAKSIVRNYLKLYNDIALAANS
jgi:hypothetical protein